MSISGIGAVGYPAAGYETRRTERNVAGRNFAKQAAQATATLLLSVKLKGGTSVRLKAG